MQKVLSLLLVAGCCLTGCSKPKTSTSTFGGAASSDDPVQMKLQELAGRGARNCGLLKSQAASDLDVAGKCVMDAAKAKNAFYVEYELPGMNVAVAGNAQGKLYSVQSQTGGAGMVSGDCPAELRLAPSGRVTCYAPGTFPMSAGAGAHSGMSTPSGMGMGGTGAPPPGHPAMNPHPSGSAKPPAKQQ